MSAVRISARRLRGIGQSLSDRDHAILTGLGQHRFLTTVQLTRWHFFEHRTTAAGTRACVRVLGRLLEHRLLGRLERRIGGVRRGSASFVWHLSEAGHRLLRIRDQGEEDPAPGAVRWRQAEPSVDFLRHHLAVAEAHLTLIEHARAGRFDLLAVDSEPACWRQMLSSQGMPYHLKPDLYVASASGDFEDHWFIEIDLGSEPLPRLLRKCRQYQLYRGHGQEQHRLGVFPAVVWVMRQETRARQLLAAVTGDPMLDPALFRTTTPEALPALIASGAETPA